MNVFQKLLNHSSSSLELENEEITQFLSFKMCTKLMQKNGSAKPSKKANESINLFFNEYLICLVRFKNMDRKYNIHHYKEVLTQLINNEVLLSRCIEDTKSICTQFVTGLSLNHVQSIHNAINNQTPLDSDDGHSDFKAKYHQQLKTFCLNNCSFNHGRYSPSTTQLNDTYFSLSVGLFISNSLEQLIRYFLYQLVQFCQSQQIQTCSADHVAYVVNMDPVLSNIANKTYYWYKIETNIEKAYHVGTNLHFRDEERHKAIIPQLPQILNDNNSDEWQIFSDTNSRSSGEDGKKTRHVYSFPRDKLTNQLYSNVSLNQDKANEFEALISSNETMKLSLTSNRMRSLDKSNSYL